MTAACWTPGLWGQTALTWEQVKEKFEAGNPTLRALQLGIEESRAQEITAHLRPNPDFTTILDQVTPFTANPYQPFASALPLISGSYLHERAHKRELRLESARKGTEVAISQRDDQERSLLFNLRGAFVQALQAKAVLALANENLAYYDKVLGVSGDRFRAGDIARVDLNRLELQRVQYESDVQTALVNVRTAKIQLLMLLNDHTSIEQFDVTGPFDFRESLPQLSELREIALANRPDLKAAIESIDKANTDHKLAVANGSTDPTFGVDMGRNPPIQAYIGFSVNIPLRFFDRNQGEKLRTQLDIRRNARLEEAARAQVFSDVDSAHATLASSLALLGPYRDKYLKLATDVRETVAFAYQHGGASLLDFMQAQSDYRSVQVNYVNLVGSYWNAVNQLSMAVGREVIQ